MSTPNRDTTQDIIKGIAITLVVYGHMARGYIDAGNTSYTTTLQFIDFAIYTFHMPAFFFLAGINTAMSLSKRSSVVYMHSRVWAVIYPYVLWSFGLWALKLVTAAFAPVNHPLEITDILYIAWRPISPFWFLYALLFMQVALVVVKHPYRLLTLALVTSIAICPVQAQVPDLAYKIATHLPYFALGSILANCTTLVWTQLGRGPVIFFTASLFATFAIVLSQGLNIPPVSLQTTPATLAGLATLIGLSSLLASTKGAKLIAYLGAVSLPIYLIHVIFTSLTRIVMTKAGFEDPLTIIAVGTVIGLVAPITIYRLSLALGLADVMGLTGKRPTWIPKMRQG